MERDCTMNIIHHFPIVMGKFIQVKGTIPLAETLLRVPKKRLPQFQMATITMKME